MLLLYIIIGLPVLFIFIAALSGKKDVLETELLND